MTNRDLALSFLLAMFMGWALIAQTAWGSPLDEGLVSQTFAVDNLTCAACPIIVKKAMSRVMGVRRIDVNFDSKTATVIFDPTQTNIAAISEAAASVGFPARAIGMLAP